MPQLFFRQGNAAANFGIIKKKKAFRANNWWEETVGSSNTRMAHELPASAALGHEKTQTSTTAVTRETGQSTGAWVTHTVTGIDRDTGETRVAAWTLLKLRRWGGSPKHVTVSVRREQDTSERPRPGGQGTTTGTPPNPEYPHSFPEAPAFLYIQPLGPTHHRMPYHDPSCG